MLRRGRQVALILFLLALPLHAQNSKQQLAKECDALIDVAVKKPFGWGWEAAADPDKRSSEQIIMQPPGSATAGLLLLWSGQALNEPKYTDAAMQAARGIAASQNQTGQIPRLAVFSSTAGGHDPLTMIPDRAATRSALLLLLNLPDKNELLQGSQQRAMQWLLRQQNSDGGWSISYPPTTRPDDMIRIIRLDTPEYRDSTYLLLLAAKMTQNPIVTKAAEKSAKKLLLLRQDEALWSTAYHPNGTIDAKLKDFPAADDVRSCQYALQTLLGSYLMTHIPAAREALEDSIQDLTQLRGSNTTWRRIYPLEPTTEPATQSSIFAPPSTESAMQAYDLNPLIHSLQQLQTLGPQKYAQKLRIPVRMQLAAAINGLADDPLQIDVTLPEIRGPIPADLGQRLDRLWILLCRIKMEDNSQLPGTNP